MTDLEMLVREQRILLDREGFDSRDLIRIISHDLVRYFEGSIEVNS